MNMIDSKKVVCLCPAISTENLGDYIIEGYCNNILDSIFPEAMKVRIPTREKLCDRSCQHIATSDFSFILGSNILSSDMYHYRVQWNLSMGDIYRIEYSDIAKKRLLDKGYVNEKIGKIHVVLMGVGWWQYQEKPTVYTTNLLHRILDGHFLHSVRDSYTEQKMREMGFHNVINTACPTMWALDAKLCEQIPHHKASQVVTTLTNYNEDASEDQKMLRILSNNYKKVYIWPQAKEDIEYLERLNVSDNCEMIPPRLDSYDELLRREDIDYVGTRLHGGIQALNYKKRSLIIAVDNRAVEISKDTSLPIIKRKEILDKLEKRINEDWETHIQLPQKNIERWKRQFEKR